MTRYNPSAMSVTLPSRVEDGCRVWHSTGPSCGVAFVGAGIDASRREILRNVVGLDLPVAWLRQIHGAEILPGHPGCVGKADALTTAERGLALAVSTADCVPVLLATSDRVSGVHAGWRGIVAGVVPRAVADLSAGGESPTAWIGPAIGSCCYEAGNDVALQVTQACGDPAVSVQGPSIKPHLNLLGAVESQLLRSGAEVVSAVDVCTRCSPELHSFRRDGRTGRNLSFVWLN